MHFEADGNSRYIDNRLRISGTCTCCPAIAMSESETGKRWRVFSLQPKRATGGVATNRKATLHRRKKTCKIDQIQGTWYKRKAINRDEGRAVFFCCWPAVRCVKTSRASRRVSYMTLQWPAHDDETTGNVRVTFLQHFCSLHTGWLLWQAGLTFISWYLSSYNCLNTITVPL